MLKSLEDRLNTVKKEKEVHDHKILKKAGKLADEEQAQLKKSMKKSEAKKKVIVSSYGTDICNSSGIEWTGSSG